MNMKIRCIIALVFMSIASLADFKQTAARIERGVEIQRLEMPGSETKSDIKFCRTRRQIAGLALLLSITTENTLTAIQFG